MTHSQRRPSLSACIRELLCESIGSLGSTVHILRMNQPLIVCLRHEARLSPNLLYQLILQAPQILHVRVTHMDTPTPEHTICAEQCSIDNCPAVQKTYYS